MISLKQANRSFPINSDIGVLKWCLPTVDEALLPLSSELLCNVEVCDIQIFVSQYKNQFYHNTIYVYHNTHNVKLELYIN